MTRQLVRQVLGYGARALGAHRRPRRRPALWIVTYHRILPLEDPRAAAEEPGMIVQPATFEAHVRELQRRFDIVSLADWQACISAGKPVPRRACAITFDDGWRDNHEFAWPVLRRLGAPATLFVVADLVGTCQRFWPNRLMEALQLVPGTSPQWAWLGDDRGQLAPTELVARAKHWSDAEIHTRLDTIVGASETDTHRELLDWDEIAEMQRHNVFEIGSHTRRHVRLVDAVDAATLEDEIVTSADLIAARTGLPCRAFCYPNGDHSPQAVEVARTRYALAVTTGEGFNTTTTDPMLMRRVHLHEDASNTSVGLHRRLAGW